MYALSLANNRLNAPVKRDAYSAVLDAHNEVLKRGEYPGEGHLVRRSPSGSDSGTDLGSDLAATPSAAATFLPGNPPTISPAVTLDEDGQDISKQ